MEIAIFLKGIISKINLLFFYNMIIGLCILDSKNSYKTIGFTNTKALEINSNRNEPFFEINHGLNMTVLENESVVLKCIVKNKGNRTISWIRRSDLHILTSENFVFSGDQRFAVLHDEHSDEWNLSIKYVTVNDSGYYECQLNTQPKIKISIHLEVTVPESIEERMVASTNIFDRKVKFAKILGTAEIHVKIGNTISLTCIVNHQVPNIQWFHNSHAIEFNSNRGGINLETEKNSDGTTSRLLLTRAQHQDSGNYTCVPHGAISASSTVHILNGEHPAERFTSAAVRNIISSKLISFIMITSLFFHFTRRTFIILNNLMR